VLEPCEAKVSRTVLRGLGAGNRAWLLGTNAREVTLRISARLILQDREAVSNARSAETINTQ
jgi:hypothetical protein